VEWNHISGAKVIVEAGFADHAVTPSQGSHFFQNLIAGSVGYLNVDLDGKPGFVDWEWIAAQPTAGNGSLARHIRLESPMTVKMQGDRARGFVFKPGKGLV
jgi:hypothetical protein